jgi:hypothetical protein
MQCKAAGNDGRVFSKEKGGITMYMELWEAMPKENWMSVNDTLDNQRRESERLTAQWQKR